MKLVDFLLLGGAVMFLIIGTDQMLVLGFEQGYWAYMLALVCFFAFTYRKTKRTQPDGTENQEPKQKGKGKNLKS